MTDVLDPFGLAANVFDPPKTGAARYYDDPVGFLRDCFVWKAGPHSGPTGYQEDCVGLLEENHRLAVRGPHGLGKTALSSWAVLWMALTRDAMAVDWKVVITAASWTQLRGFTFPEIHKWARMLNWEQLGRGPFSERELQTLGLKLKYGEVISVSPTDPQKLEGAHADCIMYVYDESKAIMEETFDASLGAFSGAGPGTGREAFALAISTPGTRQGRFYDIHAHRPGHEGWATRHVTLEETLEAGRNDQEWVDSCARLWGEESSIFRMRVLGEFANDQQDGVIPLEWIEQAIARGRIIEMQDDEKDPLKVIGVDVGEKTDNTVFAFRFGNAIRDIKRFPKGNPMETAGRLQAELQARHHVARQISAIIDGLGIGSGVVARMRETSGENIVSFNAGEACPYRMDRANVYGMANKRAAAWWSFREMLDPDAGIDIAIALEDDPGGAIVDRLIGELCAPTYKVQSGGKYVVESKDDIRKRMNGRSTDVADAVIMAFWLDGGTSIENFASNSEASFFASQPTTSRWAYS